MQTAKLAAPGPLLFDCSQQFALTISVPCHLHALEQEQIAADEANSIHVHPPLPMKWLGIEVKEVQHIKPVWPHSGDYNAKPFKNCQQNSLWYADLLAEAIHINHKGDHWQNGVVDGYEPAEGQGWALHNTNVVELQQWLFTTPVTQLLNRCMLRP